MQPVNNVIERPMRLSRCKKILFLVGSGFLFFFSPVYSSSLLEGTGTETAEHVFSLISEKIKGKVMDKAGAPIPHAIVAEGGEGRDNAPVIECDSTGCFEITVDGRFPLLVSAVGYLPRELQPTEFQGSEFLEVRLDVNPDATLEEVVVSAKRRSVVTTPTGLIYQMSANPLIDGDALETFRYIPMMMLQGDLPFVVGRGVPVVYVNNRKLNLSGQSLTAYLRSLPAKNIETVEIIRNPEARYGNAGCVLSIRLKKKEDNGVKGFLSGKVFKVHDVEEDLSLSLDYTHNKWNSFFNVFWGGRKGYYDNKYETQYLKENYTVDRTYLEKSKGQFGNANFIGVYQFSKSRSLGINVGTSLNHNKGTKEGLTFYNNTQERVASLSDRKGTVWGATANLNYQYHSEDGKRYFIADVDYLYNDYQQHVVNDMDNVDEQGNFQSLYLKEQQDVPQRSDIYSAKLEYGGKTGNGFNYDFGADAYYSYIRTDDQHWDWSGSDFVFNPQTGSNFKIKEYTPALFFDLNKWWNENFYTSLNARMEYTKYDGKEYKQNSSFKTDFFRVLPKLNVFYKLTQQQSLSYSLSYRLSRPSFYDLNPFVQRISPTEYSVGNPYLQPVKVFFTEMIYTASNNWMFYLQYQLMDDMRNIVQKDVGNGMIENKPENIGRRDYIGFSVTKYFSYLNNRGALNMNANYAWFKMSGNTESGKLNYTCHMGSANVSNSFLLFPKQNIRFNMTVDFHSKERSGYIRTPACLSGYAELNANFKAVSVAAYSQLAGYFYDGKISGIKKYEMENDFLVDKGLTEKGRNLQFGLRFSYSFGNKKVKQVQQRNTSNAGVRGRVNVDVD